MTTQEQSGCDNCGNPKAAVYKQTLYDDTRIVRLCRDHAKSRRALGYALRPMAKR